MKTTFNSIKVILKMPLFYFSTLTLAGCTISERNRVNEQKDQSKFVLYNKPDGYERIEAASSMTRLTGGTMYEKNSVDPQENEPRYDAIDEDEVFNDAEFQNDFERTFRLFDACAADAVINCGPVVTKTDKPVATGPAKQRSRKRKKGSQTQHQQVVRQKRNKKK